MSVPFHPLLLALYPIVSLLVTNAAQVTPVAAVRPALAAFTAAGVVGLVFLGLTRDRHRAAALTSLALVAFFSYGHLYAVLKPVTLQGEPLGRHRYLAPLLAAAAVGLAWGVLRARRPIQITRALNPVALVLMAMPVLTGVITSASGRTPALARPDLATLGLERPAKAPDIYYLVLDAYTRADVLRSDFGIDNRPFLDDLARLGFEVAACARSNYAQTELSLASALNLEPLDRLGEFPPGSRDRTSMRFLIADSLLRRAVESLGYRVVAFETGYAWSELRDADVYLSPQAGGPLALPLTAFEALLLDSTALAIVTDARQALPPTLGGVLEGPLEVHRQRVLFTLDQLETMPELPGPKLVFAHIVAPHRPYLLAPDPESTRAARSLAEAEPPQNGAGTVIGYRNQVLALNDRLVPILEGLLTRSAVPPVIILQGDHGPDDAVGAERMAILYAEFLPGRTSRLPDGATPVNTFQRVLSDVFGAEWARRTDFSLHSVYDAPFDFEPVADACDEELGGSTEP